MASNQLANMIQSLRGDAEIAAAELTEFAVHLAAHRSSTPQRDLVALFGAALRRPEFFAEQPLTRCPPGLSVTFQEQDFQHGEALLMSSAADLRKSILRAGFDPRKGRSPNDDPRKFCLATLKPLKFPARTSGSYHMAAAVVLLILLTGFMGELGPRFWDAPDDGLGPLLRDSLQKEKERAVQALAENILKGRW